jgi:hypothetical protein
MINSARRGGAVLAVVFFAAGSGGCSAQATLADQVPEDTPAWKESQKALLTQRAQARWDAIIRRDFGGAYAYLTPAYRDVVSLQQYERQFGRSADWRLARVANINYDSPMVASVSVEVTYRFVLLEKVGEVESTKILNEKWLYKDGGWWYTVQ